MKRGSALSNKGMSFFEVVIALAVFALIANELVTIMPTLFRQQAVFDKRGRLLELSKYVGGYVFRWADFDPSSKPASFESLIDGAELEGTPSSINNLRFADPLPEVADEYKTSIVFWETNRVDRAVVRISVWYDANLNDVADAGEPSMNFSTVVTEKR